MRDSKRQVMKDEETRQEVNFTGHEKMSTQMKTLQASLSTSVIDESSLVFTASLF